MYKSILLTFLFLVPLTYAKAGLFEDIRRGVENTLPISPRSIECDKIRSDASAHQARIASNLAGKQINLNDIVVTIGSYTKGIENNTLRKITLNNQVTLLKQLQVVYVGLVSNETSLRATLLNLQAHSADQTFNEALTSMINDPNNPHIRKLATLFQNLSKKNNSELNALLRNGQMRALFQQLSVLIGSSQVFLAQEQSYLNSEITRLESDLKDAIKRKTALESEIVQLHADYASQEERKSCNF